MNKEEKIRAEIERRKKLHEKSLINPIYVAFGLQNVLKAKISELTYLHSFIGSMQEAKYKVGDTLINTDGDKRTIVEVGEDYYKFDDCSILHFKAQDNWELVEETAPHRPKVTDREATGKLKECIDNITDESLAKARKQLEEELVNGGLDLGCGVIWKDEESVSEEQVKESLISKHDDKTCKENGNSLTQEPISDDLEEAIDTYLATYFGGEKEKQDWPFLKKMAIHFAEWKKQKDIIPVSEDLEEAIGEYCSNPDNFISYVDTGFAYRSEQKDDIPLIIKAIKFGANWQKSKDAKLIINAKDDGYRLGLATMKQQMIAKAVDAVVKVDAGGYPYIPQMELYDYGKDIPLAKEGDKYKVILIKED